MDDTKGLKGFEKLDGGLKNDMFKLSDKGMPAFVFTDSDGRVMELRVETKKKKKKGD
jgi:hypothetical protein